MKSKHSLSELFPMLFSLEHPGKWLSIQEKIGLSPSTLQAYGRALVDYMAFCTTEAIDQLSAGREHIAAYVHYMAVKPVGNQLGLANATMQQRLVTIRLYYDYLTEEQVREENPVKRGVYTPGRSFNGSRRGLLPHYQKYPWIPTEQQWQAILAVVLTEPIRNRLMFALAYEGALRRGELCSLQPEDIDPAYRLITLRAEITKSHRSRVVSYSESTSQLYANYLRHRSKLNRNQKSLFLSESRRNKAQPLTIWTWSKVIHSIAERANIPQFTTHTLRHLRLTDLARAGLELYEIATFAGHKSIDTTMTYVHLSGRELADKIAAGMDSIHTWRSETMRILS